MFIEMPLHDCVWESTQMFELSPQRIYQDTIDTVE
jgi:hypothetical protein